MRPTYLGLSRMVLVGAVALAGMIVACSSQPSGPSPTPPSAPVIVVDLPTAGAKVVFPDIPIPPDRDLYALAQGLLIKPPESIPRLPLPELSPRAINDHETFWIVDLSAMRPFRVGATLQSISPHLYMYVADGVSIRPQDLAGAAEQFEESIYPEILSRFGPVFTEGEGEAARITVLHAPIPRVRGYYNPSDLLPASVNPFSNQQRMVYINSAALRPGTEEYAATLAHEMQHAAHDTVDPTEEVWINEGLSTLAEEIVSPDSAWPGLFSSKPDTQLTGWPADIGESGPHYGAAQLFFAYLQEHYGGADPRAAMRTLMFQAEDGVQGVEAYLRSQGYQVSFDQIFQDWVVANYLDEEGEGRYSYRNRDVSILTTAYVAEYRTFEGTVSQYAADYIRVGIKGAGARIVFQGFPSTKLLPNESHSGRWQWWSNRGDSIDSTLTREFDLSRVEMATLSFWGWYDIEKDFDHAYVEVSTDGGITWDALQGRHSASENVLGTSLGPSYTGVSGEKDAPQWVQDSIDLSDYVGRKILVRFQYVTDDAVNADGLAIDDISIPEIGFFDDVESGAGGWEARGFYRTDNFVPQRFFLRLIQLGAETRVLDIPLTSLQRAEVLVPRFGDQVKEVVLVIAGATPVTTQPARYTVAVGPVPVQ